MQPTTILHITLTLPFFPFLLCQMLIYEQPKGTDELKLSGKLSLTALTAFRRTKPTSEVDHTFIIATAASGTIKIDPGSKANWEAWQEGVMAALAVPPPEEQMRKVAEIESGRAE